MCNIGVSENRVPLLGAPLGGFSSICGIKGAPLFWEMPAHGPSALESGLGGLSWNSYRGRKGMLLVVLQTPI